MADRHPQDSLELEDYTAFRRLYDRFGVKASGQSGKAFLSRILVPVTNVDSLVGEWKVVTGTTVSIGAGLSTSKVALEVPRGKRWTVRAVHIGRTTGDNLVKEFRVKDASENDFIDWEIMAGTADFVVTNNMPFTVEELDGLYIETDGTGAAASAFKLDAWVFEEKSFPDA